jgi:isopentenyl-diphosphate Delta-isomerase
MVRIHPDAQLFVQIVFIMEELVVLVDDQNNPVGTTPKATVHTNNTPLHRGFSVFLFNSQGQFFVTQRASSKKTFPGVFTNSFCGHPGVDETPQQAAVRRAREELGLHSVTILQTIPYQYCFADVHGIVENEICPVMIATTDEQPDINKDEVDQTYWIEWKDFLTDISASPKKYSPWSREEALLVDKEIRTFFPI